MTWEIVISRSAEKFLKTNSLTAEQLDTIIADAVGFLRGETRAVDIKKLKGAWEGFYRIRKGKIRVIAEFDFENSAVFIEAIDWRGNVYK